MQQDPTTLSQIRRLRRPVRRSARDHFLGVQWCAHPISAPGFLCRLRWTDVTIQATIPKTSRYTKAGMRKSSDQLVDYTKARDLAGMRKILKTDPEAAQGPRAVVAASGMAWPEGLALLKKQGADVNSIWR